MLSRWKLSGSFGPSYHLFYELSDFLTDQFNDQYDINIDDNQSLLSLSFNLNYLLTNEITAGFYYQFDIGTIEFKYPNQNVEAVTFQYASQSVGLNTGYKFYEFGSLSSSVNIFGGIIFHSIEETKSTLAVVPDSKSTGFHSGLLSVNSIELSETMDFLIVLGGEFKTSGKVKSNSSQYNFNSLNYFIRFGVDFEL